MGSTELTHRNYTEQPDSIEIGSSKTGKIKIYGNFKNIKEFKEKIDNSLMVKEYAQYKLKE